MGSPDDPVLQVTIELAPGTALERADQMAERFADDVEQAVTGVGDYAGHDLTAEALTAYIEGPDVERLKSIVLPLASALDPGPGSSYRIGSSPPQPLA